MLEQKIFELLNPVLRDYLAHGTTDAAQFSGEQFRNSYLVSEDRLENILNIKYLELFFMSNIIKRKKMTFSSKALILFFKKEFSFSESLSLFLMSSYAVTRAKCEATDSSPEHPESGVTVSLLWAFS